MQFEQIGDAALHFDAVGISGDKPLIVFINSLGTDFRIWDGVFGRLRDDFGLLRYDLRGHGLSDLGATPYSMEVLANDLAGLMDRLGCSRATICGLSVGGQIAQQLYFDRPDLVARLILCDTAAQIGTADFWQARISAIEAGGLASIVPGVMERWFSATFREQGGADFSGCRSMFLRQPQEGYIATCHAISQFDRRADTRGIAVPTLCVVGSEDGATPPDLVKDFAASIPGAQFEIIDGAGHLPCIEQPEKLSALIAAFVSTGALANDR